MDLDFLLIQKMRMGDDTAIDAFVEKYYPKILQYCRLHIRDYGYAEDLTQETFVKFFRSLSDYRHYGKVANYLYVIAGNVCKDFYKKVREIPMEENSEGASDHREQIDTRIAIETAINSLPTELKETAILFFLQEVKLKEIACILGIGLSLVKYRIKKARELLQAALSEEEKK